MVPSELNSPDKLESQQVSIPTENSTDQLVENEIPVATRTKWCENYCNPKDMVDITSEFFEAVKCKLDLTVLF
jgi:hypothetical protein